MVISRSKRAFVALASIALVATGCGDDDDDDTDAVAETTTEAASATGEIEVTAVDYGYEGLDATVDAGSTLTLTNASEVEIHELVAVRLADDEERTADELVQLPEEELGALFGGPPAMVLIAPPGGAPQMAVVGDGSLTEPGRYLLLCSIPTGADPEEFVAAAQASEGGPPDVEGGPPHFTQGMYAELTVE